MIPLTATPPYPMKHDGPAIVVGSAASAFEDLTRATALFPTAPLFVCNHMWRWFAACEHIVTMQAVFFQNARVQHRLTSRAVRHVIVDRSIDPETPDAHHVWRGVKAGSTGLGAAWVARAVGHKPVVLAGVRVDDSGYVHGYRALEFVRGNWGMIDHVRAAWHKHRDKLDGIYSMSGWTKELLGCPPPT